MNASSHRIVRECSEFGNAQSTVVKDFGAFQGATYFRHLSSVAALLRRVDARTCASTRARFPCLGTRERRLFFLSAGADMSQFFWHHALPWCLSRQSSPTNAPVAHRSNQRLHPQRIGILYGIEYVL